MSQSVILTSQLLAEVRDLRLLARTVAQGARMGEHASRQRGIGAEFAQYRAYEPGDEINKIDWKLYARSQRHFVREAERESDINIWLLVDCSASMQETCVHTGLSKLDFARVFAAALGHIACFQGDSVGIVGLSVNSSGYMPAMPGVQHFNRCLVSLQNLQSGNVFPDVTQLQSQLAMARKNSIIFLLSDFFQQRTEVTEVIRQLSSRQTAIHPIQLFTEQEAQFSYQGRLEFEDRETGERIKVNAETVKQEYLHNRQMYFATLERQLLSLDCRLHSVNIATPVGSALREMVTLMKWQERR